MSDTPSIPTSISTPLDGLAGPAVRAVERASLAAGGPVTVRLWSDALVERRAGRPPRFPLAERRYLAESLRWAAGVEVVDDAPDAEPFADAPSSVAPPAVAPPADASSSVARASDADYPDPPACPDRPPGPTAVVTGCYDLVHSGHVRFFEEASAFGALHVVVGHDANIRLLKGAGRPLVGERERRYLCGAVRHVALALVSTGDGWLDAEPEVARLRPTRYVVNGDGDRPEKRAMCERHGVGYVVLARAPKPGLAARSSTQLRDEGRSEA